MSFEKAKSVFKNPGQLKNLVPKLKPGQQMPKAPKLPPKPKR